MIPTGKRAIMIIRVAQHVIRGDKVAVACLHPSSGVEFRLQVHACLRRLGHEPTLEDDALIHIVTFARDPLSIPYGGEAGHDA